MFDKVAQPGWDRRIYFYGLGIYLVLAIAALNSGITSWDEETDYLGIRTQIAHAVNLMQHKATDYRDIHANLEYYGIIGLLPAWLLWFGQRALLTGRLTLEEALFDPAADHQLSGFYQISHLVLIFEFFILTLLVVAAARLLGLARPWLAGCFCLFLPSLLGHSFLNTKDIPFALFYTAYTLMLIKRQHSNQFQWLGFSILAGAFLINLKAIFVLPLAMTELLLLKIQERRLRHISRLILVVTFSVLLGLSLQPASWGLSPIRYLSEVFETFSIHQWGGCMTWATHCIGIKDPNWSTLTYILKWFAIKWPLFLIVLVATQILLSIAGLLHSWPRYIRSPWLLVISQLILLPVLAVLRQSNLYDADRHLLFAYPALCLVALAGLESALSYLIAPLNRNLFILVVLTSAALMILDDLAINPYQLAYLNEFARLSHNHTTTSLDYWAVSAKESLQQAQLNGRLSVNPTVASPVGVSPLAIGLRQLAGHEVVDATQRLVFQIRNPSDFHMLPGCIQASEVNRTLITGHKLVMSRLWVCPSI